VSSTEIPATAGLGGGQRGDPLPDTPMGPTVLSPAFFLRRTVGMGPMQYRMFTVGPTLLLVNRRVAEAADLLGGGLIRAVVILPPISGLDNNGKAPACGTTWQRAHSTGASHARTQRGAALGHRTLHVAAISATPHQ
jgi:hypothetical protein